MGGEPRHLLERTRLGEQVRGARHEHQLAFAIHERVERRPEPLPWEKTTMPRGCAWSSRSPGSATTPAGMETSLISPCWMSACGRS